MPHSEGRHSLPVTEWDPDDDLVQRDFAERLVAPRKPRLDERLLDERHLARALQEREIEAWHQPIVDLGSGAVVGTEVFARWHHPELGAIPPTEFIGAAEHLGVVSRVTDRILHLACKQTAQWSAGGDAAPVVHVHLSAVEVGDSTLVTRVLSALSLSGLAPQQLCLQLPERALSEADDAVRQTLQMLRGLGTTLAVDSFGGEAGLGYLRRSHFDKIKLHRVLLEGLGSDPRTEAILRGVAALADTLGVTTVAEGVETEEQRELLTSIGIDHAQGWLIGAPAAADTWTGEEGTLDLDAAERGAA